MPLTILAPFCTPLWQENGTFSTEVALARSIDATKSELEKGVGKICSVGGPVATGCGCKHRKCDTSATHACFQARPRLRIAGQSNIIRKI